ncbi:MAG: hypothetical protein KatS3mg002_1036 [Candidatus Woesearchaeota archaeon]|nr:MAG: hypothetical protein KatS3mg002_1036 [Candidatus Woesearchaeota archaeon]
MTTINPLQFTQQLYNLNLFNYDINRDGDISFSSYRDLLAGTLTSAMLDIDNFDFNVFLGLADILSYFNTYKNTFNSLLNSIGGSISVNGSMVNLMMDRFVPIATQSGSVTNYDFQSIPNTYKHLFVVGLVGKQNTSASPVDMKVAMNGVTSGSNYYSARYDMAYSTVSPFYIENLSGSYTDRMTVGDIPYAMDIQANVRRNGFPVFIFIPNYRDTITLSGRPVMSFTGGITYQTSASPLNPPEFRIVLCGGTWMSTTAINRLTFTNYIRNTGTTVTFSENSKLTLYGIK